MENPLKIEYHEAAAILDDYRMRRMQAQSLLGFCLLYLSHHLTLPPATFHRELIEALEDDSIRMLLVVAFRGSAKTTFCSLALPLWAALERSDKYQFILPIADTFAQAKINIANIKYELETNERILADYGDMKDSDFEWQATNILLKNGVRIMARSRGQKIRGLKHQQHRPKLIIIDDPEDLEWVRTKENRDKTEKWLKGEVIPALDEKDGKLIIIGNWLHTDALLARLKKDETFKVLEYPLIDAQGNVTWPAKYPTAQAIETRRAELGASAWQREMLLKIVPEEGQEVTEDMIHYYDQPPTAEPSASGTGVDLASSQKQTADYTAMVTGNLIFVGDQPRIFIEPHPINDRLLFHEFLEQARAIAQTKGGIHQFFVEDVAYQKVAIQEMQRHLLAAVPMKAGTDKRSRLRAIVPYIQNGTILFPRRGCEDLIIQLLGFGIEEHDDLVDAFVYLILGLLRFGFEKPEVIGLI
jgi:predicted phage terminase large subunit-like protein